MQKDPLEEYKYKEKLDLRKIDQQAQQIQKITCPACATNIPADDLNIKTSIAKCNSCDGIFSFQEEANRLSNEQSISQEIFQPEGVTLSHFKNELDISVKQPWTNLEKFLLPIFPFLIMFSPAFFIEMIPPDALNPVILITFLVLSLIGYFVYLFMRRKHKIYIHIDEQHLSVERRPKKFIKDKRYAIQDIDQVYIKNIVSAGTPKGSAIFMIVNEPTGQKHIELISNVDSRSKAKYIEQEIEKYLGIKDRRVPDENS